MNPFDHHNTDASAALEAGQLLAVQGQDIRRIGDEGIPFIVGTSGEPVSLDKYGVKPTRFAATPTFKDASSFIHYVKTYGNDNTLIFANILTVGGSFIAVLDMPAKDDTSWCEHRAKFSLVPTPEWTTWTEQNKKWMNQETFVNFVETQRRYFVEPNSASMLEIASSLEATCRGNYKSAFRSSNGDRTLVLDMSTDATYKGKNEEKIAMPEEITLALPAFEGQNPYQISAFLRFRPDKGGVIFQYELQEPERFVRESADEAATKIAGETGRAVLNGSF